jgi:hypothetical protein
MTDRVFYYKVIVENEAGDRHYFVQRNYSMDEAWGHARQVAEDHSKYGKPMLIWRINKYVARPILQEPQLFFKMEG